MHPDDRVSRQSSPLPPQEYRVSGVGIV